MSFWEVGMGTTNNLLYLLLLYAVLDKDGKLSTSTGLLIALGVLVCTSGCLNGGNNQCSNYRNNFNPYQSNFTYGNALL